MGEYKLDDLMEWGRVLEELNELRERGLVDEHQDGIRRVLRYKQNWRLRECALECARNINLPEERLIVEVCSVMCDEDSYAELRILAAQVLGDLVCRYAADQVPPFSIAIRGTIRQLLSAPMSPLLEQALQETLMKIGEDVR